MKSIFSVSARSINVLVFYAQGMIELRNALSDIVEEFGTDDGGFQVS